MKLDDILQGGGAFIFMERPEGALFAIHPETWASSGIDGLDELKALPRGEATFPKGSSRPAESWLRRCAGNSVTR